MRLKYDFHIHSCLSPCGDAEMTPNNIVNMAKILELDMIALTDHNTAGNCRAAMKAGQKIGMPVIAGMELCTSEEIHVVCLFPDIDAAEAFAAEVKMRLLPVKNKPHIFGDQVFMDSVDNETGREETLLVTATGIAIDETPALVKRFHGICYPAHIDRASFSILSNLGAFPPELGFAFAEATPEADLDSLIKEYPALENVRIMRSSDAHYLESMCEAADTIGVSSCAVEAVFAYFNRLD